MRKRGAATRARTAPLADEDYRQLLEFRTAIRKFLKYSATEAAKHDLTPTQHQLLLAIRGHQDPSGPTIGDLADRLLIKHHSAVELIDRAEDAGLVQRHKDSEDLRVVRLSLTRSGVAKLQSISIANLSEIGRLGPEFHEVWQAIGRLGMAESA